jgi:hypothetical protein
MKGENILGNKYSNAVGYISTAFNFFIINIPFFACILLVLKKLLKSILAQILGKNPLTQQ